MRRFHKLAFHPHFYIKCQPALLCLWFLLYFHPLWSSSELERAHTITLAPAQWQKDKADKEDWAGWWPPTASPMDPEIFSTLRLKAEAQSWKHWCAVKRGIKLWILTEYLKAVPFGQLHSGESFQSSFFIVISLCLIVSVHFLQLNQSRS